MGTLVAINISLLWSVNQFHLPLSDESAIGDTNNLLPARMKFVSETSPSITSPWKMRNGNLLFECNDCCEATKLRTGRNACPTYEVAFCSTADSPSSFAWARSRK